MTSALPPAERPPRLARPLAYGILGLLAGCAVLGAEWWPLSSFRLFSEVRGPERYSWEVVTVAGDGREHPVEWASLPGSYRGWRSVADRLWSMNETERSRALGAWASAVAARGPEVAAVRVYRVVRAVPTGQGVPSPVLARSLRHEHEVRRR